MISAVLLLVGTFLAYVLIALSGDPLQDLRQDTGPDRENRIAARTELLDLDTPVVLRYFLWLGGASQCLVPFVGECDLGQSIRGQDVTFMLSGAIG
jgi:peptide/nickel transport system permease protein